MQQENKEFFTITTPHNWGSDFYLLERVINMGIDSRLEGFTRSSFKVEPDPDLICNRLVCNFHVSELRILIRRLLEISEDPYLSPEMAEESELLASDIVELAYNTTSLNQKDFKYHTYPSYKVEIKES